MKSIVFLLIIFISIIYPCLAQQPVKPDNDLAKVATNLEWQKVELKKFSFQLPKEFKGGVVKTIDTPLWIYQNDNAKLKIYIYENTPTPALRKKPNYTEEVVNIDNFYAYEFAYTDEAEEYKIINGVSFWSNSQKGFVISLYLYSNSESMKDVAKKIFASIKFKPEQIVDLKLKTYR